MPQWIPVDLASDPIHHSLFWFIISLRLYYIKYKMEIRHKDKICLKKVRFCTYKWLTKFEVFKICQYVSDSWASRGFNVHQWVMFSWLQNSLSVIFPRCIIRIIIANFMVLRLLQINQGSSIAFISTFLPIHVLH